MEAQLRHWFYRWRGQWQCAWNGGHVAWPKSAIAAVPVRMDGPGKIEIAESVQLGYAKGPRLGSGEILLQARGAKSRIAIGPGTATSNNIAIIAMKSVEIGAGCQIGDLVSIYDCDFHEITPATRNQSPGRLAPVKIGSNVWIGSRVLVLKGVCIGDNSVVAAGSVVTKSIRSNVLAAGIPARVVRNLDSSAEVEEP